MRFAHTVQMMSGMPPHVLLLWPIWELKRNRRLPGLQPPVDSEKSHAMQLSFALSKWARSNLLWVFLPAEALLVDGKHDESTWTVAFDETNVIAGDRDTANTEFRIWRHPGLRVVFYKTFDSVQKHEIEARRASPRTKEGRGIDNRPDQILLKSWMTEAVRCHEEIQLSLPKLQPMDISNDIKFIPGPPMTPIVDLHVQVDYCDKSKAKSYIVPARHVFVANFWLLTK
jgi:hypothetical protein